MESSDIPVSRCPVTGLIREYGFPQRTEQTQKVLPKPLADRLLMDGGDTAAAMF
jgi:hypothetical protein